MSFPVTLDPDTADAVLALSVASGLTPSSVVQKLLDATAALPPTARRPRLSYRWPAAAAAAASLLLLAVAARRHARR
ncbi:MAG: hypothetical protein QN120_14715 [Armatimonadota bacterium]|nr:hypothetical protein [Armatimonadota bacterium]